MTGYTQNGLHYRIDATNIAGIFDYIAGEFIRKATEDEYRRYLKEIAHLPLSERAVGAVDGTPYGLPERIIWMEE